METQFSRPGQVVRGADGALYQVSKRGVALLSNQPVTPVSIGSIGAALPAWSDIDNSSARTFITPSGH